jgi:membrane fusion protein (multidrug efflux system)
MLNKLLEKLKEYLKKIDFPKIMAKLKEIDFSKIMAKLKEIDLSKLKNIDWSKLKEIDLKKLKEIDRTKIKKNYIWILVGLLIVMMILARTIGMIKRMIFKAKEAKEVVEFLETVPVKVYKVKKMDFKDTLPVLGRIEGFREIDMRFDSKGILESFNFEEGERILEGDIIASLDQKDALLKLKYAAIELEKMQKLYDLGGVDKIALEQKKLEYESAKRDLEKTNIYAPSDGYLGSKEKDAGSYVTPQDKVGIFVDFGEVYAAFDVIEEDSPKIELGQNAEIYIDAYPGDTYTGTIDMVSPMIEGRTRTQKVKIELDNEENKLKPGMFARAIINTYEKKDALIIPAASFKKKGQQYFVYVVHREPVVEGEEGEETMSDTGVVEEREIEVGYLTYDMAEVDKGLKEGELVIRELHQEFKDKDKVEITEVQETIF